jgi:hypothetical protein
VTQNSFAANFIRQSKLLMTISAPAKAAFGSEFSAQIFLTNNSATTTLPISILMDNYGADVIGGTSTSGSCSVKPAQAECELMPIPGNGGEASVTEKMRVNSDLQVGEDVEEEAFVDHSVPRLRVRYSTAVKFPPFVAKGFTNVRLISGQEGDESFTIDGDAASEPFRLYGRSSNTELLPIDNIVAGSGCAGVGSCSLSLTPVAGLTGQAHIDIGVLNQNGQTADGHFTVTVVSKRSAGSGGGGGATLLGLPALIMFAAISLFERRRAVEAMRRR